MLKQITAVKEVIAYRKFDLSCLFFSSSCISTSGSACREAFKNRKDIPAYKIQVLLWLEFFSNSGQTVQKIFELWMRGIVILPILKVSQVYLFSENNRTQFPLCKVVKLSISLHSFCTALSSSFWQSLSIWQKRFTLFLWKNLPKFSSTVSYPTSPLKNRLKRWTFHGNANMKHVDPSFLFPLNCWNICCTVT